MGRPKKYEGGKLIARSIAIPEILDAYIADLATQTNQSRNGLLIFMLTAADPALTKNLMKQFSDLQSVLKESGQRNKEYAEQLAKLEKKIGQSIPLYADMQINEDVCDAVKVEAQAFKDTRKAGYEERTKTVTHYMNEIIAALEANAAKKGQALVNVNVAKLMIRTELAKLEE